MRNFVSCFPPVAVAAVFGLWLLGEPAAFAQISRPSKRPAVALDVNTEAIKRLATVEDHIKERQWSQAILILQQVAAEHGEAMIEVSARRYLNVSTYCNSVLANFPPEGLAVYREKHDAQAKQWLETGLATRNRALLEKIVRQAFVSSSGDEALYWLGEWSWDQGNYAAARDSWRQLLELPNPPDVGLPQPVLRYPDSSFPQAQVVARIVLSHIMEGNQELAKNWREYLAQEFPEAQGELAGRTGAFTEILDAVLNESRDWQFPSPPAEMPTFAGNPRRNHIHPQAPEVGGVQWQRSLPEHKFDPVSATRKRAEPSLSYFPITVDGTVYFSDPERIYALDLLTGQPRWPRAENHGEQDSLSAAVIYEIPKLADPRDYLVGQPRFTLTVHENRLYARMGSPITGRISETPAAPENHLVCLDLTKEGKVVWAVQPGDVLAGMDGDIKRQWAFEGSPIVAGGRVFVAMRQSHPQTEALIACLDAESGRPQWARRVASALAGVAEKQNFISHLLVTLGENMVFYMPEFGVVTALDAKDGRQLWAVTYPSFPAKESPVLDEPRWQGLTPGVFHQGVLYAAPTDSESILAISAKTGVLLWERTIPIKREQIRHVLGVVKNRLILGGNHLWILNAATGAGESPAQPPPESEPEFDGYGRGIIAGNTVYWPTRSTIEIRDLSGKRVKQPEPYPGGNIAIGGDLLLVAEPRRLVAYSNFAQLRQKQKELISQNPNAALPRWRLAQVEEAIGDSRAALTLYEEAIAKATPNDHIGSRSLKALATEGRFRLLLKLGKQSLAAGQPQEAVMHFREAAQGSSNPAGRGEALKLQGTAQVQARQFPEAVGTFQSILDQRNLSELFLTKDSATPLGRFAKQQIASLIGTHGREIYAKFDQLAAEKIADRLRNEDLEGVEDLLKQYPNALVTSETRHRLARLKKAQGDVTSAILTWQELLQEPATAKTRQAVLWDLGTTLEQLGYLRPARDIWRQLAREFPAVSLPTKEGRRTATEFVTHRLQRKAYRQLDQPMPALPLVRRWERDRSPESHVLLPEGEPPGPALATVLIDDRGLSAFNLSNGQTRWEKPLNNPAIWAGYGTMHLVLGTKNSLSAVALESGETLWQVSLRDLEDRTNRTPQFQQVGEQILVLEDQQIRGYEAGTGRLVWNAAPAGILSKTYYADEDFVLVQTENPLRVLVLDANTGKQLSEHRPPEPWASPPVAIRSPPPASLSKSLPANRGFIAAMANRRIHAFGAFDPWADPMWTFQGGTSFANVPPRFWSEGETLLMLMDGDTLLRLDPATGKTLWFTPLSTTPFADPLNRILLEGETIYAAEDQTLSCLSIKDGKPLWKQPLPHAGDWTLRKTGSLVFAVPMRSEATDSRALIFQSETGQPVQKLQVPPGIVDLKFHAAGSVLVTQDKLLGWGPMEYSSQAN